MTGRRCRLWAPQPPAFRLPFSPRCFRTLRVWDRLSRSVRTVPLAKESGFRSRRRRYLAFAVWERKQPRPNGREILAATAAAEALFPSREHGFWLLRAWL